MNAPVPTACEVTIVEERMTRRLALVPLLLALSIGCTQQKGGPMPTHYEAALSQLDKAAASKSNAKQPDAVSQALLPPLVVEMPRAEVKPTDSRFDLAVNNASAAEVFMAIASDVLPA
jgi:MSHA biogenesis protein MshL